MVIIVYYFHSFHMILFRHAAELDITPLGDAIIELLRRPFLFAFHLLPCYLSAYYDTPAMTSHRDRQMPYYVDEIEFDDILHLLYAMPLIFAFSFHQNRDREGVFSFRFHAHIDMFIVPA